MSFPEPEIIHALVARVFRVEDVTSLDPHQPPGFLMRYRGQLIDEDSASAYDLLAGLLDPYQITPHFRIEDGRQVIYLAPKQPDPKPDKVSTNIILFVLTVFSVMLAGVIFSDTLSEASIPSDEFGQIMFLVKNIFAGWPFAASLLGILLAHEFGHYFMSRYHKTPATLPYFIPLPFFGFLGTMGAVIFMKGTPKNKRVLFDIGIAGPLAGLIVTIPILLFGLSLSKLGTIESSPTGFLEGNSILYLLAKYIVFGQMLPAPVEPQGFLYWVKYLFTGSPVPFGGTDVFIHQVATAGWGGLLVTSLNLIPAGTLDGGHVVYALFGERTKKAFPFIIGILVILGLSWNGWWLWAALLFLLGRNNAQLLDQITPLDPKRRVLAVIMLILFFLIFMPVPFITLAS